MWKIPLEKFQKTCEKEVDLLRTTFRLLQRYANAYYVVPRDLRSALGPAAHPFLEEGQLRAMSREEARSLSVGRMAALVHAIGPAAYGPPRACEGEENPPGDGFPVYCLVDNGACFKYLVPLRTSSSPPSTAPPAALEMQQSEAALRSSWENLADKSSEMRFALALCSARSEAFGRSAPGWADGAAAQYILGGLAGPSAGVCNPWLLQETAAARHLLQALPPRSVAGGGGSGGTSAALSEKLYGRFTKSESLGLGGLSVALLNAFFTGLRPGAKLPPNTAKAEDLTVAPGLAFAQRRLGSHLGAALEHLAATSAGKPPRDNAALRSWCYRKMLHAAFPKTEDECRAYLRGSAEHLQQDWKDQARKPIYERVGFPRKDLSQVFQDEDPLSPLAQRYALLWLLGALSHAPARPTGLRDDVLPRWVALTRPWPTAEQLPTLRFVCARHSVFRGQALRLELPPAGPSDAHVSPLLLAAVEEKLPPEKIAALARSQRSGSLLAAVKVASDYAADVDRSPERRDVLRAAVWFYRRFLRIHLESQTEDRAEDAVEQAISFALTRQQRDTAPPSAVAEALRLVQPHPGRGESRLVEELLARLAALSESRRRDEEAVLHDYCTVCLKVLPELSRPEWDEYAVADDFFRRLRSVPASEQASGGLAHSLQTAGKLLFSWNRELQQSRVWDASVCVERGVFSRFGEPAAAVALRAAALWEQAEAMNRRSALGCAYFMVLSALRALRGPEPQYAVAPNPLWIWAVIGPSEADELRETTPHVFRADNVRSLPDRSQRFDAILVTSPDAAETPALLWKSLRPHGFVYAPPATELHNGVFRGAVNASAFDGFGPHIAALVRRNSLYEVYTAPPDNTGTSAASEAWFESLPSVLTSSAVFLRHPLDPTPSDEASFEPPAHGLSLASATLRCNRQDLEEELRANAGATTVTVRNSDLVYLGEEAEVRRLISESSLPAVRTNSRETGWLGGRVSEVFIPDLLLQDAGDSDSVCVAVGAYLGTLWFLETRADSLEAKVARRSAEELWVRYVAAKPSAGSVDFSARLATLLCRRESLPDLSDVRRQLEAWQQGQASLGAREMLQGALSDLNLTEAQLGFSSATAPEQKLEALSTAIASLKCSRSTATASRGELKNRFLVGTSCNGCDAGMSCCAAVAQALSLPTTRPIDESIQKTADELYERLIKASKGEGEERHAFSHDLNVVPEVLRIYAELSPISAQVVVYEAAVERGEDLMHQPAREAARYSVEAAGQEERVAHILRVLNQNSTLAFLPLWEAAPSQASEAIPIKE